MFSKKVIELTGELISVCRKKNIKITTAESCTGGLIASCITSVTGSSDVFECGFITYSNNAKSDMLGVPIDMIIADGAVSKTVAVAMSEGALKATPAKLTISVTGIAGPGGGTIEKPVGTVHIASARAEVSTIEQGHIFVGNRDEIRMASVTKAIEMMLNQAIR